MLFHFRVFREKTRLVLRDLTCQLFNAVTVSLFGIAGPESAIRFRNPPLPQISDITYLAFAKSLIFENAPELWHLH